MLPEPLAPLAAYPQFVAWRLEWNSERDKWDKIPYSPIHGGKASSTNPATWGTYDQARAYADAHGMAGVGFVFSEHDPFWFLDIDGAWTGTAWSMLAQELCARLPGVAMEISQSNTGLHLIGTGRPPVDHGNRNIKLHLELYTKERFVALTGVNATGSVLVDATAAITGVAEQFFKREPGTKGVEWTDVADPEWAGPEDDAELLDRMLRSKRGQSAAGAFEGKPNEPSFEELFTGNVDVLRNRWPPETAGGDYNHSSADQSLANLLAFWTGRNCNRIERIMRMSALARSKWDPHVHATYLENTILKARGLIRSVYKQDAPREPVPPPPPVPQEIIENAGFTPRLGTAPIMLAGAQLDFFAGCVYIMALNKILTAHGDLLDQARFNVEYGGHEFVLSLDGKKTTSSAWLAFTENHAFEPPKADRICFRPEYGSQRIVMDSGKRLANAYTPAETIETPGDPSKFLDHVKRMLPYGRDAEILFTYMASVKQNPGMKTQWWPVVQGAEGNFKSFLLSIMSYAVGSHYSHMPNMEKMVRGASNFNGWVERKLFLGLDEVYAANRREFFEGFKTTVTNRSIPIEGKGNEEFTGDNRANGMIVTNHQDGVPISGRSRRYAPFFCAQQTPEDMLRDGMDAAYISDLKDWMLGIGAYAPLGIDYGLRVMNHYLGSLQLAADIDPNQMAVRPPATSSTQDAIIAGRGRVEQEILEAIGEDRPGFSGDWVSSIYLDRLLSERRLSIANNKRRDLMQQLGYDYHPALIADGPNIGRVNNPVSPDAGKPRLYCRVGSIPFLNLRTPREVAKSYSEAQLKAGNDKSAAGLAFNDK